MTYDTEKEKLGREPVWIVELVMDYCAETYGSAPCTAAVGVTGPAKCYNTRKTCQDSVNYNRSTKTYRFSNKILPASTDPTFQAIPCIEEVDMLPTKIEPGKGIGKRATLTITFKDFAHGDIGIDKYESERGYNTQSRGTFWTKFFARNPYYQGRTVRIRTGYIIPGQPPVDANFQNREYIIERFDGPGKTGYVKLTAKDPLRSLDDKRSLAPRPSTGVLALALNDSDGVFDLSPAGIGNTEYAASGVIRLEEELILYTRSGDTLTVSRGYNNTVAVAHDANTPAQECLYYNAQFITDIVYDLLVNYASIPSGYIDTAAWLAEASLWMSEYNLTAIVTKPTSVASLLASLTEECQFFVWWDEKIQKIPFKAVRPWAFDQVATLNDANNIIERTQSVKDKPDDRVSEVLFYYGQKNPVIDLDQVWNYSRAKFVVDLDAESENEFGDKRIKIIYSRWLTSAQVALAVKAASRILNRYRNTPKEIMIRLDAKDSDAWTGDVVLATMRSLVDYSGLALESYLQVIGVREVINGTEYEYILSDTGFSGRYCLWAPDGLPDFPGATDPQRARYGWYADADEELLDGTPAYLWA